MFSLAEFVASRIILNAEYKCTVLVDGRGPPYPELMNVVWLRCLILTLILIPALAPSATLPFAFWQGCGEHTSSTVGWSSLKTYLKLNETATGTAPGGKDFADSSTSGNHAVKVNGVTLNQEGTLGKAVSFTGDVYSYISAPTPGLDTTNAQFNTVMFWMNWNGNMPSGNQWSVAFGFSSMLSLTLNGPNTAFGFCTYNNDVYGISSAALTPNTWYHITAIIKNGTMTANKLYINGVAQTMSQRFGSPYAAAAKVSTAATIGNLSTGDNFAFQGLIDDVAFFSGAIADADILTIYNRESSLRRPCN